MILGMVNVGWNWFAHCSDSTYLPSPGPFLVELAEPLVLEGAYIPPGVCVHTCTRPECPGASEGAAAAMADTAAQLVDRGLPRSRPPLGALVAFQSVQDSNLHAGNTKSIESGTYGSPDRLQPSPSAGEH